MTNKLEILMSKVTWKWLLFTFCTSIMLATLIITQLFGHIDMNPEASMDSEMGYSVTTFFTNIEVQGEIGRHGYLQLHGIDYIFMTQFYGFLFIALGLLLKGIGLKKGFKLLLVLPFTAFMGDLVENLAIDISIIIFPAKHTILGIIATCGTTVKFLSIYTVFILIILLMGNYLVINILLKLKSSK